jgi:SHS2 domain-containing protein
MDAQGANTSRVQHGEWTAMLNANEGRTDLDLLLLAWLDEVLYQAQTKSRWMLSADVHITQDEQGASLRAMVAYVNANDVIRGVEVKAISSHELTLQAVQAGETLPGKDDDMPSLVGPAWYADVLLDV